MILLTEYQPAMLEPLLRLAGVSHRGFTMFPPQPISPDWTDLVVVVGRKAWTALKTRDKFHQWRGFLYTPHVYVTDVSNPKQPLMDDVLRRDWEKIPLILSGRWPRPVPERTTLGLTDFVDSLWLNSMDRLGHLCIDVESGVMTAATLGGPGFQVFRPRTKSEQESLHRAILEWARFNPFLFHNAPHDLRELRLVPDLCHRIDDTMLLHAVLHPGLPHSLRFLQSVYGQYPLLKGAKEPGLHCWGDVLATIDAWEMMKAEHLSRQSLHMASDEQWARYEELLQSIPWAMSTGANLARVADPTYYRKPFKEREEEMV